VQQISPPLRIVLIAVALLGAVWFVALRPKGEAGGVDAPLPQAPGVAGLAGAVSKAQGATGAANASVARSEQAAKQAVGDAPAAAAAPAAKAKPSVTVVKTAPAKVTVVKTPKVAAKPKVLVAVNPATPLLVALDRGRVVILMFRNRSSDSAAVARMVRSLDRRRKVVVRVASINDVGKYQTFTADTPVAQAPTTLVIGPSRRAKVIVGFTSVGELAQAVADVRRAGPVKP
jgi:hypothetical protein